MLARAEAIRLTNALTVAEERTRVRIASGLHDDIGQLLTMVRLRLHGLAARARSDEISAFVGSVEPLLVEASASVRSAAFELTSPVLQQLGLVAAIESLAPRISHGDGPAFAFTVEGEAVALDQDTAGVLFRIVRELVFNVRKHASATRVEVSVRVAIDGLSICVRDDGVGCTVDPSSAPCTSAGGYGLYSSLAQMRGLGGDLTLRARRGGGTEVALYLPTALATNPR
jgi:signal transduction histidine kinase